MKILLVIMFFLISSVSFAADVMIKWELTCPSGHICADPDSVRIYYTTNDCSDYSNYELLEAVEPTVFSYIHSGVDPKIKNCYLLTSTLRGFESEFSDLILKYHPIATPPNTPWNVQIIYLF